MSDLVDRLRADYFMHPPPTKLQLEAADEIEQLRKLLAATERDLEMALAALDHHLKADRDG
jgi:hypothetical protein